jgi:Mg/Co/Ni transporter MgtE
MGVEDATEIRALLGYKDGTAGGMMTTKFVQVSLEDTVADVVDVLRELPDDFPTVHYVYVADDYGKLKGVASMRTLVLAQGDAAMKDIIYTDLITATPDETEDDVVADIFKYDIPAMPVVDEAGRMLGIVTTDDAWDAIEEDVSTEKTQASALRVVGLVFVGLLVLVLYTLVLVQIMSVGSVS